MERYDSVSSEIRELFPEAVRLLKELRVSGTVKKPPAKEKLRILSGISCIAFDVYGTLFSSRSGDVGAAGEQSKVSAFDAVLDDPSIRRLRREAGDCCRERFFREILERHSRMKNSGTEYPEVDIVSIWQSVLESLVRDGFVQLDFSPRVLVRTAVRAEAILNPVFPMPGARELLSLLTKRTVKRAIVSNAQFFTPLLFDAYFGFSLDDLGFDRELRIWSYQTGIGKPSAVPYELLAHRLGTLHGIPAERTVFIGNDMLNDIAAAASVGFRTVLFAGDASSLRLRPELTAPRRAEPDAVVASLLRIPDIILP